MPVRLASPNVLRGLDLRYLLPVPHSVPGAGATAKENQMDLALALGPSLLAHGMEKAVDLVNANNTYRHPVTNWMISLDPGAENWVAIWDPAQHVVCEARVTSPGQAIKLLQVYGMLPNVSVTDG